jgi:heme/copper-type cytochrome/quinol oxidase subunit 1
MSIYKPYQLLLLAALSLLISGFLSAKGTIDLHFHDTYFVIDHVQFYLILSLPAFVLWTIYLLTRNILLSHLMTWVHVALTLLAIGAFICLPLFSYPARYVDVSPWSTFNEFQTTNKIIAGIALIFTLARLILIVNIVGGIVRRLSRR